VDVIRIKQAVLLHGLQIIRSAGFDLDDFSAVVMPATGADAVRQMFIPAICTGDQVPRLKGVMRTTAIPATF
jgi:hypothetical protein